MSRFLPTAQLITYALAVPLAYLYCEDFNVPALLLALHRLGSRERGKKVWEFLARLSAQ